MRILVDPLDAPPPHALSAADIQAIFAVIPEEWREHLCVHTVRVGATMPEHSRFARPVIYSGYSLRLTVCSRGLGIEQARREVLRELAIQGLRIPTRMVHRLSRQEMQRVDRVIAPLLALLARETEGRAPLPSATPVAAPTGRGDEPTPTS